MRPYLAILYDSFREALHSRVLWILLILIVVVLLAVAPFTVTYPRTGKFFGDDMSATSRSLAKQLSRRYNKTKAAPNKPSGSSWNEGLQ